MNKNALPGEGKLFLVSRTPALTPVNKSHRHLPKLTDDPLIPLAALLLAILVFAGYACLYGNWAKARDFLCIFLPPVMALMGAASTAHFRS